MPRPVSKKSSLVITIGKQQFTTSTIIADGVGLDHASVIKLVRKYQPDFEEFGFLGFEIQKKRGSQGAQTEYAILSEDQATYLITLLRNSEVVRAFKIRLVKAFRSALRRIAILEHQQPEWQDGRKLVSLHQRDMTDKLVAARTAQGKPTHSHHFGNEALLLTYAVVGKSKPPIDRNALDADGLRLFAQLEELNGSLILAGLPYEQRKDICRNYVTAGQRMLGAS